MQAAAAAYRRAESLYDSLRSDGHLKAAIWLPMRSGFVRRWRTWRRDERRHVEACAPHVSHNQKVSYRRVAWCVLAWNILVVLWGAYVRASGAGAGCGSHWPLCNGDVVPRAPRVETIIEFTHRITSGLALLSVGVMAVWAWRAFPSGSKVRKYALLSVVFILVEALLGAGLVLLRYVDKNASIGRAFYLAAHLANTQILLAMIALAGWFAARPPRSGAERPSDGAGWRCRW